MFEEDFDDDLTPEEEGDSDPNDRYEPPSSDDNSDDSDDSAQYDEDEKGDYDYISSSSKRPVKRKKRVEQLAKSKPIKMRKTTKKAMKNEDDDRPINSRTGYVQEDRSKLLDDFVRLNFENRIRTLPPIKLTLFRTEYGSDVLHGTWDQLYDHQREGCRWMYNLYERGVGGILGDDMGLGKTCQVCTHLGSLGRLHAKEMGSNGNSNGEHARSPMFLVVCPSTVLEHWLKEMRRWEPNMRTLILHSISDSGGAILSKGARAIEKALHKIKYESVSAAGVTILMTYDGVRKHIDALNLVDWTAVCLDEGQKIRNHEAEITKACKLLPCYHRLIISGSPIQNSLDELWSLLDFVYPGRLGSLPIFQTEFCDPIRAGGYAGASSLQTEVAVRTAATLQRMVKPYLLRRLKRDLQLETALPSKTERVLFCRLSRKQASIYHTILDSSEVDAALHFKTTAFRAIMTLRKLCNHPSLVIRGDKILWHKDSRHEGETFDRLNMRYHHGGPKYKYVEDQSKKAEKAGETKKRVSSSAGCGDFDDHFDGFGDEVQQISWEDSGKLIVLKRLLQEWYAQGHKVLLFSQTQSMLDIVERLMKKSTDCAFRHMRLDGGTAVSARQDIVDTFNNDASVFLLLLTTRVGGLGISLIGANRVVILDPDWNPSTDSQARERAWRLGQRRDVVIYRLICKGTIEEKMYERQIFKLILSNRILINAKQKNLFAKTRLRELFTLGTEACNFGDDLDGEENDDDGCGRGKRKNRVCLPAAGLVTLSTLRDTDGALLTTEVVDERKERKSSSSSRSSSSSATGVINDDKSIYSSEGATDSPEAMDSSEGKEKHEQRMLVALFNGDAISGVYDHAYLESGPGAAAMSEMTRRRIQNDRLEAQRRVEEASRSLRMSARAFVAGDDDDTNAMHPQVHQQHSLSAPIRHSSSSAGSKLASPQYVPLAGTTVASRVLVMAPSIDETGRENQPKFGRRFGMNSTDAPTSSELLLNFCLDEKLVSQPLPQPISGVGSRASTSYRQTERSASLTTNSVPIWPSSTVPLPSDAIRYVQPGLTLSDSAPVYSSSHRGMNKPKVVSTPFAEVPAMETAHTTTSTGGPKSMKEGIKRRLLALLPSPTGQSAPRQPTPQGGLSTARILKEFADLGDQYAVVFKEMLRSVACLDPKDKLWRRK